MSIIHSFYWRENWGPGKWDCSLEVMWCMYEHGRAEHTGCRHWQDKLYNMHLPPWKINDLINKTQNQFIFLSLTAIQTQTSKTGIPAAWLKPQVISQLPKTLPFSCSASLSPTSLLLGLHLMQKQSSQLSGCLELETLISHVLLVLLSV